MAKLWADRGGIEIDADLVARNVVAPNTPGEAAIRETFGKEYFDDQGQLNRKALGNLVFSSKDDLAKLEAIVHPLVREQVADILENLPPDSIAIYTVPLLVEANVQLPFNAVVTVEAPEGERIRRLMTDRSYTLAEAKARVANQAGALQRAARADYILNSNQDIELLRRDANLLWDKFLADSGDRS